MDGKHEPERIDTIVIGAGQAGLSAGYHLARRGVPFVILDADARIGDHWRRQLGLAPAVQPGPQRRAARHALPGAERPTGRRGREMGDYLEAYAAQFGLPVRAGPASIGPAGERSRWRLRRDAPASVASMRRAVIVATGAFNQPARPGLRDRPRSVDRAAAFERVPQPGAAARGLGARRRGQPFGRRHRVRGGRHASHAAGRPSPRRAPVPGHRYVAGPDRLAADGLRRQSPADDADADRPTDGATGADGWRPAAAHPQRRPGGGRRRAPRREGRRRHGRQAGAGRRHRPRRRDRDLEHRLPADYRWVQVPGFVGDDGWPTGSRGRGVGTRPVLPGCPVPLRVHLDARGRRRARRRVRRRSHRGGGPGHAPAPSRRSTRGGRAPPGRCS